MAVYATFSSPLEVPLRTTPRVNRHRWPYGARA